MKLNMMDPMQVGGDFSGPSTTKPRRPRLASSPTADVPAVDHMLPKKSPGGGMSPNPRQSMATFSPSQLVRKHAKSEGESVKKEHKEMGSAHPGFKAVQAHIAQESGEGEEAAGKMLAANTRRASPAAKRANPKLKKVKG